MALNFPNSPTPNQIWVDPSNGYRWSIPTLKCDLFQNKIGFAADLSLKLICAAWISSVFCIEDIYVFNKNVIYMYIIQNAVVHIQKLQLVVDIVWQYAQKKELFLLEALALLLTLVLVAYNLYLWSIKLNYNGSNSRYYTFNKRVRYR